MLENLSVTEKQILERLKTIPDPEVEVNIVDLGLIYEIRHNEKEKNINIVMTLSARGCPVGDTIMQHVETVTKAFLPEYDVNVELTWEPQWTPEMITPDGKALLNM
ncbi:MAG: metal-sulfur cluster assembly factor [Chlorobi bacterium]|nr:metal-sulfur cluster assembly factor [Chlorobiota bacterium]